MEEVYVSSNHSCRQIAGRNSEVVVRPARDDERIAIARCIAEGFERDFSFFRRNVEAVAKALEPGIRPQKFYVAVQGAEIVGVAGISDALGRAVHTDTRSYRRHLGLEMGTVAVLVLKREFERQLPYPPTTGFIEFVATRKRFRHQGVASGLLREGMRQAGYAAYVLDVMADNHPALSCYAKLGFRGVDSGKERGGRVKVLMRLDMS